MYSILVVETGEFLYEVENQISLYTSYELLKFSKQKQAKIYKEESKKDTYKRLVSSNKWCRSLYRIVVDTSNEEIVINYNQTPNAFEIVEV